MGSLSQEDVDCVITAHVTMSDRAVAYTNLVMTVGYAGVFGLWTLTREYLTSRQTLWTAVFLLVSLSAFVLFEVWKAFLTGMHSRRLAIMRSSYASGTHAKLQKLEDDITRDQLLLARWWIWIWGISVVFGIASISLLLFSLICGLASA